MMWNLLIVDDEPSILSGLKQTLDWKSMGFSRVDTATGYHDAIDKAVELRPDIGIFDVCIGEYKGHDIITKLNEMGIKSEYIIISGYEKFEYVRLAMKCGAKQYLLKPINRFELKEAVENIIAENLGGSLPQTRQENIDPILGVPYESLTKLTNKIILIVKEDFAKNLSIKTISELFKMNNTYLGQIFLKDTKLKFSEYLMSYRMIKAREMIESSSDKISYIARCVGYANINYFYSHFKLYFGVSPSDLRKKATRE